jgi:hypothetical protein
MSCFESNIPTSGQNGGILFLHFRCSCRNGRSKPLKFLVGPVGVVGSNTTTPVVPPIDFDSYVAQKPKEYRYPLLAFRQLTRRLIPTFSLKRDFNSHVMQPH